MNFRTKPQPEPDETLVNRPFTPEALTEDAMADLDEARALVAQAGEALLEAEDLAASEARTAYEASVALMIRSTDRRLLARSIEEDRSALPVF